MVEPSNNIKDILTKALTDFKQQLQEAPTKENGYSNAINKNGSTADIKPVDKLTLSYIQTEMTGTVQEIIAGLTDLQFRKANDDKIIEIMELEKIDDNTIVYYFRNSAMMMMSDRDFVVGRTIVEEDGSTYIVQKEVEHSSKPFNKKYVRGKMIFGTTKLTPDVNDPTKVKIVQINMVDIDFNPPQMMISKMQEKRLDVLTKIQERITKNKK